MLQVKKKNEKGLGVNAILEGFLVQCYARATQKDTINCQTVALSNYYSGRGLFILFIIFIPGKTSLVQTCESCHCADGIASLSVNNQR